MAVPACCSIWVRERLAVSTAKSASMMREREALRFSDVVCRLVIAVSKRDCRAPNWALWLEMAARAPSTVVNERVAESTVETSKVFALWSWLDTVVALK